MKFWGGTCPLLLGISGRLRNGKTVSVSSIGSAAGGDVGEGG